MKNRAAIFFLLAGLLLAPFMPGNDSLWIDEAQTWNYADQPDAEAVFSRMKSDSNSEAQMPLGMLSAWAGAQVLGKSEWQMRAQNVLWIFAALVCFFRIGRLVAIPILPLLLAIQPFTWYYVNEFRPYTLQIFSGSLICWGFIALIVRGPRTKEWVFALLSGILLLCPTSMLGVIPSFVAVLIVAWHLYSQKQRPDPSTWICSLLAALSLVPLGLYYLSTLLRGTGGAKLWAVGAANLIGTIIEIVGFSGFLPSRQNLRDLIHHGISLANLSPLFPSLLGSFALFVVLGYLLIQAMLAERVFPTWCKACLGYFTFSFFGLVVLALAARFPFWGRHLAPAFPGFVLVLGFLLARSWRTEAFIPRAMSVGCCSLLLFSSLNLRFDPLYSKDDYRSAAAEARKTVLINETVWWAADKSTANYYGIFPVFAGEDGKVFHANNRDADYLGRLPTPDVVLFSKEDVYDKHGALKKYLVDHGFSISNTFPAFTVWERKGRN